ncbi:MAG: ATP-binding cassette domain-containing protein [Atopobiaceae bacterium]|nr:ATP-binding cassette domain-containing protein [Atopobiaceae bacterium]
MIRFDNASFHYGGEHGTGEGVDNINLTIADGECVLFCGRSGCGKTTLTRMINGLAPHFYEGLMEGAVYVDDVCVSTAPLSTTSSIVGSVFQNPKSQFFNVDSTGELAFGCENQCMSPEDIQARIQMTCKDMQLDALMNRNIFDLSGGEKQQIACGSVYAAQPKIYVMDEPSSNLDRKAIKRLHSILARIMAEGNTIVLSEHRLYYLMDLVDRIIYVEDGRVAGEYTAAQLATMADDELQARGLRCTSLSNLQRADGPYVPTPARVAIDALDLSCNRGGVQILDIERLALPEDSIVALIGDNGCGKSTLSEALCGVIPASGSVGLGGTYLSAKARQRKSFLVMQDVNRQLFSESVIEEVLLNSDAPRERALKILDALDLAECADRHPASLSGGQKQRVAIASALCAGKDILFYDEPTSGLDRAGMESFGRLLRDTKDQVKCQVIVTHDPELIMQACTHVMRVDNGRVLGVYPLDAEGIERVRYYFQSEDDGSTSRKREKYSVIGKILSYTGVHKRKTIAAAVLMTLGAVCQVLPYVIAYRLIDAVVQGGSLTLQGCLPALAAILGCLTLYAVLYVYGLQLSHRAAYRTLENIRCSLQEKMEAQPIGTVRDMGTGAVKKLFNDDVDSIELLLAHMIPEGIANLAVSVVVLLVMAAVDWRLCLLTLFMVGFGASASAQMMATGVDKLGTYFAATKRLNNTIVEYVNGMEVVRVFNRGGESYQKFEESTLNYRDFALEWYRTCWPWMAVYGSIFFSITLYTLPFGALLVLLGQLSISSYVLCLCMSFGIGPLLTHVMTFLSSVPQVNYKIQALEKAMDRMPLKAGDAGFEGTSHDVSFDDVHFGYGNDEVLKGISFVAHEGQMTALVGPSGSGKSTIAKLIVHYYDVESGRIRLGGQDLRDMSLEALNTQVSYVSQDLFLFNQSIMENIRVGRPDANDEEVLAAARRAQCDEFVSLLPQGYQTSCGSAGTMLSGGQRQRIAFARAMLKDAPVVVLDEATAYIDPENAEKMNSAVAELVAGKTVIVIAHRLSSIAHAHKIIVVDDGRILAEGTHEELLSSCPLYVSLWNASEEAAFWGLKGEVAPLKEDRALEGEVIA